MFIDKNNIKSYVLGVIDIKEQDDWLIFRRYSEAMYDKMSARNKNVATRVASTASVKLEFLTKGGEISFDYEITPGNNREYYSIDLLVNGELKHSISEDKNNCSGSFKYTLSDLEKDERITLYFPATVCMKIKNLVIPDDAKPHTRKGKILVLGDSLSQGYNPEHFYAACMNVLGDIYNSDLINQAVGGDCYDKENIEKLDFNPDFIIVCYGINDWASGKFKNGESASEYYKRLVELYPEAAIFAILPPEISYLTRTRKNDDLLFKSDDSSVGIQTMDDVRAIISEIAKPYKNIKTINARDFIPDCPEAFFEDHIHLTDYGNMVYGTRIAKAIKELI